MEDLCNILTDENGPWTAPVICQSDEALPLTPSVQETLPHAGPHLWISDTWGLRSLSLNTLAPPQAVQ